jgi:NAD(P)-dependent dehydrogenase (short-subunit alcohol dehydrogenase family)
MGRATALLFAREGAKVVGSDIDAARIEAVTAEVTAAGGTMIGVAGNIAKLEDAESLVKRAIDEFGQLDVLVNNAGIMDHMEGVANFKDDTFDRVFGVNVYGPFVTSRAAVNHMKQRRAGAIINVASVAGVTGAAAGAVYTASKHALVGLSRNTAYAYAPFGIRCNTLIVGGVETNIMAAADPTKFDGEALAQFGKWHAANPRTLQPNEVAALSLFLASDEASGISGAEVAVDAGWTAAG